MLRVTSLAILLLAGCRAPDYFPMTDTARWEYAATEYAVRDGETTAVGASRYAIAANGSGSATGVGKAFAVTLTHDDGPFLSFFVQKRRTGVFIIPAAHLDGLEPTAGWIRLLDLPLRVGAAWSGDESRAASLEVIACEDVGVPAGQFRRCFRVRVHAEEPWLTDFWVAPDVGVVKWRRRLGGNRFEIAELESRL